MLDLKEEAKFKELKDKCRELKVPAPPEIFIGLQVHDKNGVLVFDDKQRGHSWTRNYYNDVFWAIAWGGTPSTVSFGAGYISIKKTDGALINGATYIPLVTYIGLLGQALGLVVGTGDTAFSVEQYNLATLIAHGGTAGTFGYAAESAIASAYTAGTKTWKATRSRVFNNNSGGSITVKEVGILIRNDVGAGANALIERSVLDPTVAVANAAQLTVTYEISMDFSAID